MMSSSLATMSATTSGQRFVYFFGEGHADGDHRIKHLLGGKGASLAEMTKAQLRVPPGFTISAECCDLYLRSGEQWPDGLEEEVRASLARLERLAGRSYGKGDNPLLVAVRSGAAESMPGMMDTLLNVGLNRDNAEATDPWQSLREAINAVFRSWNNPRAVAYRQHHQIEGLLGTAVTVQVMCPAEVAGVMFTLNPVDPGRQEILIESSYGLGEAIVLGKVDPDRFVLDKATLKIIERSIGKKTTGVAAAPGDGAARREVEGASLRDELLVELARLGLGVEDYFQHPCDVEWALAGGEFYLLQARPIKGPPVRTARTDARREVVRQEEIAALESRAEPGGTVWARFNLSEILPEPTPMTWAVVRRFMSGRGGFGLMYRDFGFEPDPALDEEGVYDLICGRPYCNLSREPRMQFPWLPLEHPFAFLKAHPERAIYPQPLPNFDRAGWSFWLLLPLRFFKLFRSTLRIKKLSRTFAERFRTEIVPPFVAETRQEAEQDLSRLETGAVLERLRHWTERTLNTFARDSLKPTGLAGVAMERLERAFVKLFKGAVRAEGDERSDTPPELQAAKSALRELVMGVRPDPDADLPGALRDLAAGRLDRTTFLERFGHRGNQEMELAQPRWHEDPSSLEVLVRGVRNDPNVAGADPGEALQRVSAKFGLTAAQRSAIEPELKTLQTYLGLRETGKHYLMLGYALIRRCLVELDRRFELGGGIFFLTPDELSRLVSTNPDLPALRQLITERRERHALALDLAVPQVLFSDDLDAIGREVAAVGGEVLQGTALSAGVGEGPALVLLEPTRTEVPAEPYILVCPSTDPAWVPLFLNARGLVMETGGVLSHGAIVARDFGLPAVAGLPDVHRRIRTGQRLRVDGNTGRVNLLVG
jgi:pyruvate,water dikinase